MLRKETWILCERKLYEVAFKKMPFLFSFVFLSIPWIFAFECSFFADFIPEARLFLLFVSVYVYCFCDGNVFYHCAFFYACYFRACFGTENCSHILLSWFHRKGKSNMKVLIFDSADFCTNGLFAAWFTFVVKKLMRWTCQVLVATENFNSFKLSISKY